MIDIKQGDCLKLMKEIPNKSINMILCDLPYGTQKNNGCKWDIVIPFDCLWEEYGRIITDNGSVVLFGKEPFTSILICSNINQFKYRWNWIKDTKSNFMQANYQPLNNVEDICVFSKAYARSIQNRATVTYNPQYTYDTPYKIPKDSKTTNIFSSNHHNGVYKHNKRNTAMRFPYISIQFNSIKGKDRLHPTQKPVALLEYLIKTHTNEGETVLDNCMGSGSTGVACLNTNRNFIGYELDTNYFNIAKERLEQHENKITIQTK